MVSAAYRMLVFYPLSMLPCVSARALRISIPQSNDGGSKSSMPRLVIACLVFFLVLLALLTVKLVYMKCRRFSAIRSQRLQSRIPHSVLSNSSSEVLPQARAIPSHSTLFAFSVGCLGSPSCETDRKLALDEHLSNQRRTASLMYRLRRESKCRSSASFSVVCNSSNSVTSQVTPSISSEDAADFWPPPSADLEALADPIKVWPGTVTTLTPKRCSLVIDHPYCRQLGDFTEKFDHNSNSFEHHIQNDWTTTVADYSPASLRLVGASVTAVPHSFLYASPSSSRTLVSAPLTATRDSLQLARIYPKLTRKPVPSLPPLPISCFPEQGPSESDTSLSDLSLSPLPSASICSVSAVADEQPVHMNPLCTCDPAKVEVIPPVPTSPTGIFTPCRLFEHVTSSAEPPLAFSAQKMNRKTKHKRLWLAKLRNRVVPSASPLRMVVFQEETTDRAPIADTPLYRKRDSAIDAGQMTQNASYRFYSILDPTSRSDTGIKSHCANWRPTGLSAACSAETMQSLAHSNVGGSLSDLSSLQTPKFDHFDEVDIGMLGLDRFRWPEDDESCMQSHSSNVKSDSVAVTSFWEEGQWAEDSYSCGSSDVGIAW